MFLINKKIGFSKGTLYYMKKNAEAEKPFTLMLMLGKGWRCGEVVDG
jgi:hypothetical protein